MRAGMNCGRGATLADRVAFWRNLALRSHSDTEPLLTESAKRVAFWRRHPRSRPQAAVYVLEGGSKVRPIEFDLITSTDGVIGLAWCENGRWHGITDAAKGYVAAGAWPDLEICVSHIVRHIGTPRPTLPPIPEDPAGELAYRVRHFDWSWFQSDDHRTAKRARESWSRILALGVIIGVDQASAIFRAEAPIDEPNPFTGGQL